MLPALLLLLAPTAAALSAESPAGAAVLIPQLGWVDAAPLVANSGWDYGWNHSVKRCEHGGVDPCTGPYARLPLAAKTGEWCDPPCPVRSQVWGEGQNGAGLYLAFKSDAATIWLNATTLEPIREQPNCGSACGSGLDMYAFDETVRQWRWVSTTTNTKGGGWDFSGSTILRPMVTDAPPGKTFRYRIHLPIYNGLTSASIGVPCGAHLSADTPSVADPDPSAVLFYGTSIVNGHVASRPGMIFTNVLSRMLQRPVVNLGFGGNGKMERSVGVLIGRMKRIGLVVIDCNWNMNSTTISTAAVLLVKQLREQWSATKPIVLAEGSDAGSAWITPGIHATQLSRREALAAAYAKLVGEKVSNLHYVNGEDLIGKSGAVDLPTAMGTHPTDLGHHLIAKYYAKTLPAILNGTATQATPAAAQELFNQRLEAAAAVRASVPDGTRQVMDVLPELIDTASKCQEQSIEWTNARTALHVGGRADWGGLSRENFYDRFPLNAKANVTSEHKGIWGLSKCPTGMYVGFKVTGHVTSLWVNFSVHDKSGMNPSGGPLPIMPPVGRNGVDLYAQHSTNGEWVWAGNLVGNGDAESPFSCGPVIGATGPIDANAAARYMLYLPLWRACSDDLSIGIPTADYAAGGRVVPESNAIDESKPPIVWYGTSILHGAAVTRAGDSFSNRISRAINQTIFNFGFSGSGHMDIGIGLWLVKIKASMYIIDCNWNMQAAEITRKTAPLVKLLRAAHPATPIVLAEGTPDGDLWFEKSHSRQQANNAALKTEYLKLKAAGDSKLFYVESAPLYQLTNADYENPTVGGCHPSDLGARDIASFYADFLPTVLNN